MRTGNLEQLGKDISKGSFSYIRLTYEVQIHHVTSGVLLMSLRSCPPLAASYKEVDKGVATKSMTLMVLRSHDLMAGEGKQLYILSGTNGASYNSSREARMK